LAGVYTFSFLVMGFLVLEIFYWNLNVKLPRPEKAKGISVVLVSLIVAAFIGNVQLNVDLFYTFIKYLVLLVIYINNAWSII
jgi:hypothetical protein